MDEPRLIADQNVGKLATWLRMLGYDTLFFTDGDDAELVATTVTEGRVLLTRDTELKERRVYRTGRLKTVIITSDNPAAQLRQVISELNLTGRFNPLSRCLVCNTPLVPRDKSEIAGLVPPYVYQTQEHYRQCPNCGRIYWRGTHWAAMLRRIKEVTGS